jgi:hypothetical protein
LFEGIAMSNGRKDDYLNLVNVAQNVSIETLVRSGHIQHPRDFDPSKKIRDYGITFPQFLAFSDAVIKEFTLFTGRNLNLPRSLQENLYSGTFANFLSALPGQSTTHSSGPIVKRDPEPA